jgi:hypothetical protein
MYTRYPLKLISRIQNEGRQRTAAAQPLSNNLELCYSLQGF